MSHPQKRSLPDHGDEDTTKKLRTHSNTDTNEPRISIGDDSDNEAVASDSEDELDQEFDTRMNELKKKGLNQDMEDVYTARLAAQGIRLDDDEEEEEEEDGDGAHNKHGKGSSGTTKSLASDIDDIFAMGDDDDDDIDNDTMNNDDNTTDTLTGEDGELTSDQDRRKAILDKAKSTTHTNKFSGRSGSGIVVDDDDEYLKRKAAFTASLESNENITKFGMSGEFLQDGRYVEDDDEEEEGQGGSGTAEYIVDEHGRRVKPSEQESHDKDLVHKKTYRNEALEKKTQDTLAQFDMKAERTDPYPGLCMLYTHFTSSKETVAQLIKRLRPKNTTDAEFKEKQEVFQQVMETVNGFMAQGDYDFMSKTQSMILKVMNLLERSRKLPLTVRTVPNSEKEWFIRWGEDLTKHGPNAWEQMQTWNSHGYFDAHVCYISCDDGNTWQTPKEIDFTKE